MNELINSAGETVLVDGTSALLNVGTTILGPSYPNPQITAEQSAVSVINGGKLVAVGGTIEGVERSGISLGLGVFEDSSAVICDANIQGGYDADGTEGYAGIWLYSARFGTSPLLLVNGGQIKGGNSFERYWSIGDSGGPGIWAYGDVDIAGGTIVGG